MEGQIQCLPDKKILKEFIITKPLFKGIYLRKKKIKTMNNKMTTNSQLSTTEPKKQKQKLSKQLKQEQNRRNGDHREGYQQGGGGGRMGGKVQGIRRIIGRHK